MRIIKSSIIYILALALATLATSCQEDKTLYYNNMTMGNIVDGRFVSDQGHILNVVDQTCDGKLDTLKRAIIVCDILNVTDGASNQYDVRVHQLASVLAKSPVALADATGDIEVTDPINMSELWYSGGYLNLYIQIIRNQNSTQAKHLINLVYEKADDGSYIFELRHNGFGDVYKSGEGFSFAGAYVSFPITKIIAENSAKITIRWKWYETTTNGWSGVEKEYTVEYDWKRGGYEQAN